MARLKSARGDFMGARCGGCQLGHARGNADPRYTGHTLAKFLVTMFTGFVVGVVAVALTGIIDVLLDAKNAHMQAILSSGTVGDARPIWLAFAWLLGIGLVSVFVAALMVQFWAPTAAGAGVSLVMAYLNGNDVRCVTSCTVLYVHPDVLYVGFGTILIHII